MLSLGLGLGLLGCADEATPEPSPPAGTLASATPGRLAPAELRATAIARHDAAIARLADERERLAVRYGEAATPGAQAEIRAEARRLLEQAIVDELFPAWLGMPWGMASNSTATRPHEPGKTVGCSYFVTSVLLSAGVELENRFTFAQAPAIFIQRSLAPAKDDLHRYFSIPAAQLRNRIAALGDGLYVIGLDTHVGFVVVRGDQVQLVHASYTGDRVVTDEPLLDAAAIDNSRPEGYFVTPLFQDGRLVDLWLRGQPVPFQRLGA